MKKNDHATIHNLDFLRKHLLVQRSEPEIYALIVNIYRNQQERFHELDQSQIYLAFVCLGIAHGFTQRNIKQALPALEESCRAAPDEWDGYFWLAMVEALEALSVATSQISQLTQRVEETPGPGSLSGHVSFAALQTSRRDPFGCHGNASE